MPSSLPANTLASSIGLLRIIAQSGFTRPRSICFCLMWIALLPGLFFTTSLSAEELAQEPAPGSGVATKYSPWEGIEPDGRIPQIDKAALVRRPERWRYIPEGRIKPGNVIDRLFITSFIAPFIFRDSDVGTGGGLAITDIDFRQQRRREFAGIFVSYSSEGQQNYSIVWRRWLQQLEVPQGGVLQAERSYLQVSTGYNKTLTRRFFGLGDKSAESDESSYTDEAFHVSARLQHALDEVIEDGIAVVGLRAEAHNLTPGEVSGIPTTDSAFPELFSDSKSEKLAWLNMGFRWDTRDSQVHPYRGLLLGVDANLAPLQDGGDFGAIYGFEAEYILPVWPIFHSGGDVNEEHPPTDTIAFDFLTETVSGRLPFFSLPSLGGSYTQRGYIANRWTGDSAWHAAGEYRFWVLPRGFPLYRHIRIERLGFALFYELGAVSNDSWSDSFDSDLAQTYGWSVRFTLERSAPFRVDFAFSEEDFQLIARFGLSF